MACEVPVIAARVGDIDPMAHGCLLILQNPTVREALGKSARELTTREFCASKIVLQYEDLYRRTIDSTRTRR